MLTLAQAYRTAVDCAFTTDIETVSSSEALGRIVAMTVVAQRTTPPYSNSAMDGYAVALKDLHKGCTEFEVVGESRAGAARDTLPRLKSGQAMRIFTGAVIPSGADHIVMQEQVTRQAENRISTDTPVPEQGQFVRTEGLDFKNDQPLIEAGTCINPQHMALLAAAGVHTIRVHRRVKVAIIANGDELVEAFTTEATSDPTRIVNSIKPTLDALISHWGGRPQYLGIARDTQTSIESKLEQASDAGADICVTVGGASVGDYDLVKQAVATKYEQVFSKISVRPGKPTWLAKANQQQQLLLGLPGNPASAIVCAYLLLYPLITKMQGSPVATNWHQQLRPAELANPITSNGDRDHLLRANCSWVNGTYICEPCTDQDSSLLYPLTQANALLWQPANSPELAVGADVSVLPLV